MLICAIGRTKSDNLPAFLFFILIFFDSPLYGKQILFSALIILRTYFTYVCIRDFKAVIQFCKLQRLFLKIWLENIPSRSLISLVFLTEETKVIQNESGPINRWSTKVCADWITKFDVYLIGSHLHCYPTHLTKPAIILWKPDYDVCYWYRFIRLGCTMA